MDIDSINQHSLIIAKKTNEDLPLLFTSPLSYISFLDVPDIASNEWSCRGWSTQAYFKQWGGITSTKFSKAYK